MGITKNRKKRFLNSRYLHWRRPTACVGGLRKTKNRCLRSDLTEAILPQNQNFYFPSLLRCQNIPPNLSRLLMLELRPSCECCDTPLPPDSHDARICSFECTFCVTCVEGVLQNRCPNCGGEFVRRPIRPKEKLGKYPPSATKTIKPRGCV